MQTILVRKNHRKYFFSVKGAIFACTIFLGTMLNNDKELKLYYSIKEVSQMLGVADSLVRYWEKEFPQLKPKRAGRGVRQYTRDDIEQLKLIYHLVKERGMTLPGARQCLKNNKEATKRNFELVERLKALRKELIGMRDALDAFTYEQVEELKENIIDSMEVKVDKRR